MINIFVYVSFCFATSVCWFTQCIIWNLYGTLFFMKTGSLHSFSLKFLSLVMSVIYVTFTVWYNSYHPLGCIYIISVYNNLSYLFLPLINPFLSKSFLSPVHHASTNLSRKWRSSWNCHWKISWSSFSWK